MRYFIAIVLLACVALEANAAMPWHREWHDPGTDVVVAPPRILGMADSLLGRRKRRGVLDLVGPNPNVGGLMGGVAGRKRREVLDLVGPNPNAFVPWHRVWDDAGTDVVVAQPRILGMAASLLGRRKRRGVLDLVGQNPDGGDLMGGLPHTDVVVAQPRLIQGDLSSWFGGRKRRGVLDLVGPNPGVGGLMGGLGTGRKRRGVVDN